MSEKEDTYHWGLIVGPKKEVEDSRGTRFHAKEFLSTSTRKSEFKYEEVSIPLLATQMLLVRVMIAKIENHERMLQILRAIPIRNKEDGWNCVGWVREALVELQNDGKTLGTAVIEWAKVRDAAMNYCQRKKDEHRFDGVVEWKTDKAATFDLIDEKEVIP
ncbi:uncharacterized protein EAF01_011122 [Botrytis porri]|uniref:Uncharacterized protein n=1 Tax=Botrytis porri TaxID=87229 RepID=A0A4Z1KXY5_9HELO|nr:uncharacterized protein EAF01_011122 [Botrytis porri]KAF7887968.1 hypothetical protein EAF01_011122 [Botrytis porri]TGO89382.1 hypothetical protein BPOR_0112g00130 [Botrytis porri]